MTLEIQRLVESLVCILLKVCFFAELEAEKAKLLEEIEALQAERKDKVLRQRSQELKDKMEILVLENQKLKEIIREKDEEQELQTSDNGSVDSACNCGKSTGDISPDKLTPPGTPILRQTSQIAYV